MFLFLLSLRPNVRHDRDAQISTEDTGHFWTEGLVWGEGSACDKQ